MIKQNLNWGVRCPFFKSRNISSTNETWIKREECNSQTTRSRTNNQAAEAAAGRRRTHVFLGPGEETTAARSRGWDWREQINAATLRQRGSGLSKPERPVAAALLARLPHQPTLSCGRADDDVTTGRHPAGLARASLSHFHDILIRANTCDHQRAAQEQFPLFPFLSIKTKQKQNSFSGFCSSDFYISSLNK